MKKLFILGIFVLITAMLTVGTVQASSREDFYLEKVCPSWYDPNACDILNASPPFARLSGGQILYTDRVYWENPGGHLFEIARIEIRKGDGSGTARGQIRWTGEHGLFTIMSGTGSLKGLHANGRVEFKDVAPDGRWIFTLSGTYHVEP